MPDKHRQKLDRIHEALSASIGTLAARTAVEIGATAVTQNYAPALYQGAVNLRNATEGEGLSIYVSDGDLSLAEVEECIEAEPLHGRDTINLEQSRRNVQYLGSVSLSDILSLNEGNRLPMMRENIGWKFWAYNPTGAAMTTGAVLGGTIWVYGRFKD